MSDPRHGSHQGFQYGASPGSSQQFPPPPRDSYGGYDSRDAGSNHYAPPPGSGTYRPPQDEGYRPSYTPSNMQVTQYDDYDRRPRSGDYASRAPGSDYDRRYAEDDYYHDSGRPRSRHSRRSSRSRMDEKEKDRGETRDLDRNNQLKSLGVTLAGGAAGLWAGREFGKRSSGGNSKHGDAGSAIPAVVGALVGAFGARKLEEKHERSKSTKRSKSRDRDGSRTRGRSRDSLVDEPREGRIDKIKRSVSRSLSRFRGKSRDRAGSDSDDDRRRDDSRHRPRRSRRDSDYD